MKVIKYILNLFLNGLFILILGSFLSLVFENIWGEGKAFNILIGLVVAYFVVKWYDKSRNTSDGMDTHYTVEIEEEALNLLYPVDEKCNNYIKNPLDIKIDFHYETAVCPSCGVFLEQKPRRKKICKKCDNEIYVRSIYLKSGEYTSALLGGNKLSYK